MMKKLYFKPEIETVAVEPCDIITASGVEVTPSNSNNTYTVDTSYDKVFGDNL